MIAQLPMTRRRYERVSFFCELTVAAYPGGPPRPARSMDLSLGGVGLATDMAMQRGELVRLAFQLKDARGRPVVETVLGRVAHCRADEDGNFLGIEFLEPLRADAQPALVARLEAI